MRISEFAKATGLSRDTIRFYVKRGLLQPVIGIGGNNRYQDFDGAQVDRVLLIRQAQRVGFTLREIIGLGAEFADGKLTPARQARLMRERTGMIDEQMEKLVQIRRYFERKIGWLDAGAKGVPPAFSDIAVLANGSTEACASVLRAPPTRRVGSSEKPTARAIR
jgi:MerR family copper efflux transcriptional regulator